MITPQTLDAIEDLSAYAGSYEIRLNALKCAKSISAEIYESIGLEDFAIQATLNVLHYFDPDDGHTSNIDVVRLCFQTLQQQYSNKSNNRGFKLYLFLVFTLIQSQSGPWSCSRRCTPSRWCGRCNARVQRPGCLLRKRSAKGAVPFFGINRSK